MGTTRPQCLSKSSNVIDCTVEGDDRQNGKGGPFGQSGEEDGLHVEPEGRWTYQQRTDEHQISLVDFCGTVPKDGENPDYGKVPQEERIRNVVHGDIPSVKHKTKKKSLSNAFVILLKESSSKSSEHN